jgi:hypothetical protein
VRCHDYRDELLDLLPPAVRFELQQPPHHNISVMLVNQRVHSMADIHDCRLCLFKKEAAIVREIK